VLYALWRRGGMAEMRKRLMLAGPLRGEEGAASGRADELVDPGQALAAARQWAARLGEVAPLSLNGIRIALRNGINTLDDAVRAEQDLQPYLSTSADLKEGMTAFLAKRPPRFSTR